MDARVRNPICRWRRRQILGAAVLAGQALYLKERDLCAEATTLPSSIFMSSLVTSATRRSRSDLAAVSTAVFAASETHLITLRPLNKRTLETRFVRA